MTSYFQTPLIFKNPNNNQKKPKRKVRPTRTPKGGKTKKYKPKIFEKDELINFNEYDSDYDENNNPNNLLNSISKLSLQKKTKNKSYTNKHKNIVTITKSLRLFNKRHIFKKILVEAQDIGSGCSLYLSTWCDKPSVTKLMPMFKNEEFTKEENEENAIREYEIHEILYRKSCEVYGMLNNCVCPILACCKITKNEKEYLAIVMPKYECNLREFIELNGELRETEAIKLLNVGINFLILEKNCNIIHNDIKPENIFVNYIKKYVIKNGKKEIRYILNEFVFGDFGCSVFSNEEFPFGPLTGTLTMWDIESLGNRYGKENGCSYENDLYGFLGSIFDGLMGQSFMENLLDRNVPNWEDLKWDKYTQALRMCRKYYIKNNLIKAFKKMELKNMVLMNIVLQLAKPRKDRSDIFRIKQYLIQNKMNITITQNNG